MCVGCGAHKPVGEPSEVRLAIVMNGGVSLAVWMSGVTHELDNVRMATLGDVDINNPHKKGNSVRPIWKQLLGELNKSVVIDIIAGSSAGGLNGTVLATAIANECEVSGMKDLWLTHASLEARRLVRTDPETQISILDGDYFETQVKDLMASLGVDPSCPRRPAAPECVLLVTATSLSANEGDDSRRVYRFATRAPVAVSNRTPVEVPERNDFLHHVELSLAARASASFPGAFQPVFETSELRRFRHTPTAGSTNGKGSWLMDGGVLDNAPFEPVLEELRRRAVDRPFERVLLYVNPSAAARQQKLLSTSPDLLSTLAAFVTVSREPDRRSDQEQLNTAHQAMGYTSTDPDHLLRCWAGASVKVRRKQTKRLLNAAEALFDQYQVSRRQALSLMDPRRDPRIGRETGLPPPGTPPDVAEIVPTLLAFDGDNWQWGLSTADRILRWWGRWLAQEMPGRLSSSLMPALADAQRQIRFLDEELWRRYADCQPVDWLAFLRSEWNRGQLAARVAVIMQGTAACIEAELNLKRVLQTSLHLEVVTRALSWREDHTTDVPHFKYWELTPAATSPLDLLAAGDQADWPALKLYGERWGHFGAFASTEGRAWDWLWGRLDSAMTLFDQLTQGSVLKPEELRQYRRRLTQAILDDESITPDDIRKGAESMRELSAGALWARFVATITDLTRASLIKTIIDLPGALLPGGERATTLVLVSAVLNPDAVAKSEFAALPWRTRVRLRLLRRIGRLLRWYAQRKLAAVLAPAKTG